MKVTSTTRRTGIEGIYGATYTSGTLVIREPTQIRRDTAATIAINRTIVDEIKILKISIKTAIRAHNDNTTKLLVKWALVQPVSYTTIVDTNTTLDTATNLQGFFKNYNGEPLNFTDAAPFDRMILPVNETCYKVHWQTQRELQRTVKSVEPSPENERCWHYIEADLEYPTPYDLKLRASQARVNPLYLVSWATPIGTDIEDQYYYSCKIMTYWEQSA